MSSRDCIVQFIKLKAIWKKLPIAKFQGAFLLSFTGTISVCAELISKIMPETHVIWRFAGNLLINKLIPFPKDTLLWSKNSITLHIINMFQCSLCRLKSFRLVNLAFIANFRLRCYSFVQGKQRSAKDMRTARFRYLYNHVDIWSLLSLI